jgi:hypothetical protein
VVLNELCLYYRITCYNIFLKVVASYPEQHRCGLQSKVTARVYIGSRKTVSIADGSRDNDHRNIDEECHYEGEATLDKEVSASSLPKSRH